MAGKRIEMKDLHSIVLMLSQGYGTKHISAALGCARNTVKAYRAIIASKGLTYDELLSRREEELERFFISKKPEEDDRLDRLEDAFKNADGELGCYFGVGMGSVLFQEIREFRSLAYSTSANVYRQYYVDRDWTPVYLSAVVGTQGDKTIDAMTVLDSLIKHLPLSEKRFEMIKKEGLE